MITPAQEKQELANFVKEALEYLDDCAEGVVPRGDPAALFATGQVCLRRLQQPDNR